jgi:hypothetical protein
LIPLPNPPEYISEEIQLPFFLAASLFYATTDKLETPSSATPESRSADARTRKLKMNSKWLKPFPSCFKNSTSTRKKLLRDNLEVFWTISMVTRRLKIILLSVELDLPIQDIL